MDHKGLTAALPALDAPAAFQMGIVFLIGEAGGMNREPMVVNGLLPEGVSIGHIQINIGLKAERRECRFFLTVILNKNAFCVKNVPLY
ncbi:MAG: hypothetical protein ACI3XG_07480 [Faecousia sp.]